MKIQELKAEVYKLAGINTTQQLKAKYEEIRTLDMRQKTSWEKAFGVIRKQKNDFKDWIESPPEEYKDLFSEIKEVSQGYDRKSSEAKQLIQEVISITNSLEELAETSQDEANQLKQELEAIKRISKQAELN